MYLTASALAYISILSLIPMLAAFSFIGERLFAAYRQRLIEIFSGIAPYAQKPLLDQIASFLDQAESLRGLALLLFISTAIFLFATIEEALNRIWKVPRLRPLKVRFVSFLLLLFWGPVAVGATLSSLTVLRQSPGIAELLGTSGIWRVLLFLVKLGALTMLYWLVPHTSVRLRCALAGGALAAVLLELLNQGFELYTEFFRSANLVYGSFSLALVFAVSLDLSWIIVLIGSEVAYTTQNFHSLTRRSDPRASFVAVWVGLAAVALIARRLGLGEPIVSRQELADELRLAPPELDRAIRPLLAEKVLKELSGDEEGFLLATDPHGLSIRRVFHAYDFQTHQVLSPLEEPLREPLLSLFESVRKGRERTLEALTLAELLERWRDPGKPVDAEA